MKSTWNMFVSLFCEHLKRGMNEYISLFWFNLKFSPPSLVLASHYISLLNVSCLCITTTELTPNTPLIHTSFTYSKLNMGNFSVLTGFSGQQYSIFAFYPKYFCRTAIKKLINMKGCCSISNHSIQTGFGRTLGTGYKQSLEDFRRFWLSCALFFSALALQEIVSIEKGERVHHSQSSS